MENTMSRSAPGESLCEFAGQLLAENYGKNNETEILKAHNITFKEDVTTTTASGSYTTLLATTLYEAAISDIQNLMELVIINDDLKNSKGGGALQIPRSVATVAVEVAEGAVVNYFDEGIDSFTVSARKIVVGTAITWEIKKRGMSDMTKNVLRQSATAITRKLGSDIVNGLAAAAATTIAGGITYDKIIDAEKDILDAESTLGVKRGYQPTHLVLSPSAWQILAKSADWKTHVFNTGARPGQITMNPEVLTFNTMKIVRTPLLTAAQAIAIDANVAALLVRESDLETFEGPINGKPYDSEVVALMSYVLAVIYTDAIVKIIA